MKNPIKFIILFFAVLVSLNSFPQNAIDKNEVNYEIKYLFTGAVSEPFDSIYIIACVINNADLLHPVKVQIFWQKDNQEIVLGQNNGGQITNYIYANLRLYVPLGYLDPNNLVDSLAIEQESGGQVVLHQKDQDYISMTDTTQFYQLKLITETLYNK